MRLSQLHTPAAAALLGTLAALLVPGAALARERPRCGPPTGTHCHTLLVLGPGRRTSLRRVPIAGAGWTETGTPTARPTRATGRAPRGPRAQAAGGLTVRGALTRLTRSGAISAGVAHRYATEYAGAERSLAHLSGTRRAELGTVMANLRQIAAGGGLGASRLPALFLTLARNRQWWTTGPLPSSGAHVSFPGSRLVWEYYAGQGIEIQWLATFGEANGYYLSGNSDNALRQVLQEAIPLAASRAGGIAWEYLFEFDGGSPPWTSALSQGTALQALARAYQRLRETQFLQGAESALAIFKVAPPTGVSVARPGGDWYAQYTYAPHDYILNGFIQSLVGLYDFTSISGSQLGERLFEAGDAVARREVSSYNTGSWSRYDQYSESDLSYHELLTEFLTHLCERTRQGEPLAQFEAAQARAQTNGKGSSGGASAASVPGTARATAASSETGVTVTNGGTSGGTVETNQSGGGTGQGATGATGQSGGQGTTGKQPAKTPVAGDQIYCSTASAFYADVHTPPHISLLTTRLPTGARGGVQVSLSKAATVSLTVRQGTRVIWTNSAAVESGRPRLLWVTPRHAGSYAVSLRAVDRAGNVATASGTITLAAGG